MRTSHRFDTRRNLFKIVTVLPVLMSFLSCESFLDVDVPNSKLTGAQVFEDDASATSALVGIYLDLYSSGSFAAGGTDGIVSLAGLSADELVNNLQQDVPSLEFQNNMITPTNAYVLNVWTSLYRGIFEANSIMERLESATGVTAAKKTQFKGEALFIRALCNFYLVNLFGNAPLLTTSDYKTNAIPSKSSVDEIYGRIKDDLLAAESLISENYVDDGRIRPNKYAVAALEARVYLFTGDWARAEDKATKVISASSIYKLPELSKAFLANSPEAIWQIKPADGATATNEGVTFGTTLGPRYNILRKELIDDFEAGDQRAKEWITWTLSSSGDTLYLPFKYKKQDFESLTTEYSMVLRLAEQFLIRAEARAHQNKLADAVSDIDQVRGRAGLPLIQTVNPGISQTDLLNAITHERRVELMVEWGHRWLDIKRWNTVDAILAPIKNGWTASDALYPIPESEILKNQNLKPQNTGY